MVDLSAEDREALDQVYISHLKKEIERLREIQEAPSLNQEGREHPSYDNPRDPFASPDRSVSDLQALASQPSPAATVETKDLAIEVARNRIAELVNERDAALARLSAGSVLDAHVYATNWKRQIVNAGVDENRAQQAVALAALNGLFDHIPTVAQPTPLPDEEATGKEAIRLLDLWTETKGAGEQTPYQDTMALLGKPNSAGWVWAREVRYERNFDAEQEQTRKLAMECVQAAEEETERLRAELASHDAIIERLGMMVSQLHERIEQLRAPPQAVPEGYALVPLTPTPEMIEVGCDNNPTQWNEGTNDGFAADVASDVYVSMVRAASQLSRPTEAME